MAKKNKITRKWLKEKGFTFDREIYADWGDKQYTSPFFGDDKEFSITIRFNKDYCVWLDYKKNDIFGTKHQYLPKYPIYQNELIELFRVFGYDIINNKKI